MNLLTGCTTVEAVKALIAKYPKIIPRIYKDSNGIEAIVGTRTANFIEFDQAFYKSFEN